MLTGQRVFAHPYKRVCTFIVPSVRRLVGNQLFLKVKKANEVEETAKGTIDS